MKPLQAVLAALWVSTLPLTVGADLSPPLCYNRTIAIGETVYGQLTTACSYTLVPIGAPEQKYTYYYENYYFSGTAGQQISILLTSSAFDGYVELYNSTLGGQALAADDNGAGGYDARIPPMSGYFTLPATGTYKITPRTAQPNSTTGSYTLTLSATSAIQPPPATNPNLNQHGLTGTWYEQATSGQGFLVEVYPDFVAAGTGLAFVSWFTYDAVVGGPERQRWYALGGPVVSGQASSLTIYQATGGNFNAAPIVVANPVGTATLSFDSCVSGQLSYYFTDGSGRTGDIPLTRITKNVTCSTTDARPTNADFALSGNWYDPATSGQGLTIEVNPNSNMLFFAWYTYAPSGTNAGAAGQRWYSGQSAAFVSGSRSVPVTLYETTGGAFDAVTNPAARTVAVGTGTIAFQSCSAATLRYSFTGGSSSGASGTLALERVGPVPAGCVL